MEIIFATANKHKLEEARQILGEDFILKTPADYGLTEEIPETCDTIEGNARQKAEYILKKLGKPCFADDTGLFVDILNGAPGVYSARYAGPGKSASDNIARLLEELRPFSRNERKAHFSTVIAFATPAETLIFEGRAEGRIATVPSGEEGFGYDPVFMTSEFGEEKSFSELTPQEKNSISHRGEAMRKFAGYLKKANQSER